MNVLAVVYIFLILLFTLLYLQKGGRLKNGVLEYWFIGVSFFLLMIIHVAVDPDSVDDLPSYRDAFQEMLRRDTWDIFNVIRTQEHGYAIFTRLITFISHDFTSLLFVYNLVLIGAHFILFKRYSPYIPVSIIFFLFTYSQSMIVLRQYLAMSILLFTIPFVIEKKIIPFLLFCTIAFFIHHSSIIWVPLFFIHNIINKKMFVAFIILMIIVVSQVSSNIGYIITILPLSDYEAYLEVDKGVSIYMYTEPILYFIPFLLCLRKKVFEPGINRICFIALIIVCLGYIFAPPMQQTSRMLQYYKTLEMISVPITMYYMKNIFIRLSYIFSVIVFEGYFLITGLQEPFFVHYSLMDINIIYYLLIILFTIGFTFFLRKKVSLKIKY